MVQRRHAMHQNAAADQKHGGGTHHGQRLHQPRRCAQQTTAQGLLQCSMKCKICLIDLAEEISILQEDEAAFFHVGFSFFYFSFSKQGICCEAGFMHLGAEVKRGAQEISRGRVF